MNFNIKILWKTKKLLWFLWKDLSSLHQPICRWFSLFHCVIHCKASASKSFIAIAFGVCLLCCTHYMFVCICAIHVLNVYVICDYIRWIYVGITCGRLQTHAYIRSIAYYSVLLISFGWTLNCAILFILYVSLCIVVRHENSKTDFRPFNHCLCFRRNKSSWNYFVFSFGIVFGGIFGSIRNSLICFG